MENFSLSDISAVMGNKDNGFGGNGSILWFIIILFFLGGNNGFGRGNDVGTSTSAGVAALDSSYSRGYEAAKGIADGIQATYTTGCNTQKEVLENRYVSALEFQKLSSQNAQCCCELKTAIHAEGEATRALMTQNVIQELRDEKVALQLGISQSAQTSNILNTLGRYVSNPAVPVCGGYPIGACGTY